MIRFYLVIIKNLFNIAYMMPLMSYYAKHPEKYSDRFCYEQAKRVIGKVMKAGHIQIECHGKEKLPKEGGYIMFPNHQGKFDALGIIYSHDEPCSVVMDDKRARMFMVSQFMDLVRGKRLKRDDIRQALGLIKELAEEAKNGKKYIIFPEGGYYKNYNTLTQFKPGCFKSAMKAKVPIVPVAIIDSYKAFEVMSLKKVITQVHFLSPLTYEEYKGMTTVEVAELVKDRIFRTMCEYAV